MKQSDVERALNLAEKLCKDLTWVEDDDRDQIGKCAKAVDRAIRALRPRRSRDTERLRVGDLVVPTDHIITVRRINADGVWTGHNSDKQWWCCRSQDNLVRVRAKGRGGR